MKKYLLYILPLTTVFAFANAQIVNVPLDVWNFNGAANLSFQGPTSGTNSSFANSGSNNSLWTNGGYKKNSANVHGAMTDGNGNLVITDIAGAVYRIIPVYTNAYTTGKYRLTLDLTDAAMNSGSSYTVELNSSATGSASNPTGIAAKIALQNNGGFVKFQCSAITENTVNASGIGYWSIPIADFGTYPVKVDMVLDFDVTGTRNGAETTPAVLGDDPSTTDVVETDFVITPAEY
jgi:hypothetical protein